jgi:hypothetical protein
MLFVKKKHVKFFSGLFFIAVAFLYSCNKDTITYVETIPSSNNPAVTQVDTFTGNYIVYRPDSFITNQASNLFVGYHNDPVFGKTKCESYMRFTLPGTAPETTTNNAVYDSMALIVYVNNNFYGDTTSTLNVTAYRVTQDIPNIGQIIYNTSHFAVDPTPLGTKKVRIRPSMTDTIVVKLDDALGNEIFNFYKNNAQEVATNESFSLYFKGMKLVSDDVNTNVIYSFKNTGFVMRMYYHIDVAVIQQKHVDFTSGNNLYQSYSVKTDRTGTILAPLDHQSEMNATDLGNRFFLQELTGLKTRINFPSVIDIPKQATFVRLLRAQLEIKPAGATTGEYPLSPLMYLYLRNISDSYSGPLYYPNSNVAESGSLYIDQLYAKDTRYTYDVTDYVNNEIYANTFTSRSIVPVAADSLSRQIIGSSLNNQFRSRLIVSALTYQK